MNQTSMEKPLNSIPKRPSKHSKNRKKQQHQHQQPLKVVYITNPIKFETSASEFRALVQELTGQDATYPLESAGFPVEAAGEINSNVHAAADEERDTAMRTGRAGGSDPPPEIGSGTDEAFYSAEMNLIQDVLRSFDGI